MRPSLQEQLQYLTRIVNPNYIIIAKNKADKDMDFSQFKINEPEVKEKKVVEKRYLIIDIEWSETQRKILVKDTYFNNRVVFDLTCNNDRLEENLVRTRRTYKADTFEKI